MELKDLNWECSQDGSITHKTEDGRAITVTTDPTGFVVRLAWGATAWGMAARDEKDVERLVTQLADKDLGDNLKQRQDFLLSLCKGSV